MTIHPKKINVDQHLTLEDISELVDCIELNKGKIAAWAMLSYADWLVYNGIKYIEHKGLRDLNEIAKFFNFTLYGWDKQKNKQINDFYMVISEYYYRHPEEY